MNAPPLPSYARAASDPDRLPLPGPPPHRGGVRLDASALVPLFLGERRRLYYLALRVVGDPHAAESLVQETFLQAMLSAGRFEGRAKASTWLRAIALNLSRAHRRKAFRSRPLSPDGLERLEEAACASGAASGAGSPERAAIRHEEAALVQRALERLPAPYREVITLRDLHGLSTREVAGRLGVREGAVRVRLHRARRALGGLLAPYFAEADVAEA